MDRKRTKRFFKAMREIAVCQEIPSRDYMVTMLDWWYGDRLADNYPDHVKAATRAISAYYGTPRPLPNMTDAQRAFISRWRSAEQDNPYGVDEELAILLADKFADALLRQESFGVLEASHLCTLLGGWAYECAYSNRVVRHYDKGTLFSESMPPFFGVPLAYFLGIQRKKALEEQQAKGTHEPISLAGYGLIAYERIAVEYAAHDAARQTLKLNPGILGDAHAGNGEEVAQYVLEQWGNGMRTERWLIRGYAAKHRSEIEGDVIATYPQAEYICRAYTHESNQ